MSNKHLLEFFIQILIGMQFFTILFICNTIITNIMFLLSLLFYMMYVIEDGDF